MRLIAVRQSHHSPPGALREQPSGEREQSEAAELLVGTVLTRQGRQRHRAPKRRGAVRRGELGL